MSAIESFLLAMVNFPELQLKAQEEIDRVVGRSRLPDFSDEADLPYLSAVLKEVLRFVGQSIPVMLLLLTFVFYLERFRPSAPLGTSITLK